MATGIEDERTGALAGIIDGRAIGLAIGLPIIQQDRAIVGHVAHGRMAGLTSQNLMTTQRTCGKCGAPVGLLVPDNLCLNCLLDTAVEPEAEIEISDTAPDTTDHRPGTLGDKSEIRNPKSEIRTLGRFGDYDMLEEFGDYDMLEEIGRGGMGVPIHRSRRLIRAIDLNRRTQRKRRFRKDLRRLPPRFEHLWVLRRPTGLMTLACL